MWVDFWNLADAGVISRQLRLGPTVSSYDWAYYGQGVGPITFDVISCYLYKQRLGQCVAVGLCAHRPIDVSMGVFVLLWRRLEKT